MGRPLKTHQQYEDELLEREIDAYPIETYVNDRTSIEHICFNGHVWNVSPNNLLKGTKCPKCADTYNTKTTLEYLADLESKNIEFSPIESYVNSRTPINHECIEGHIWKAKPARILEGSGCPECTNNKRPGGYNSTRFHRDKELANSPGILYIIVLVAKSTDERVCVKVGITKGTSNKDVLKRAAGFTGYEPRIQKLVQGTLEEVFNLEQELHSKFSKYQYKSEWKFGGHTELFEIEQLPNILKSIRAKV